MSHVCNVEFVSFVFLFEMYSLCLFFWRGLSSVITTVIEQHLSTETQTPNLSLRKENNKSTTLDAVMYSHVRRTLLQVQQLLYH